MTSFVLCHHDISQDEDLQMSYFILKIQLTDQQWSDLLLKQKKMFPWAPVKPWQPIRPSAATETPKSLKHKKYYF